MQKQSKQDLLHRGGDGQMEKCAGGAVPHSRRRDRVAWRRRSERTWAEVPASRTCFRGRPSRFLFPLPLSAFSPLCFLHPLRFISLSIYLCPPMGTHLWEKLWKYWGICCYHITPGMLYAFPQPISHHINIVIINQQLSPGPGLSATLGLCSAQHNGVPILFGH